MFYELPASREGKVLKVLFRKRKSTVLGKGRKIWISTLIPACIVCMAFIAGPHRYLLKYYYFNKHNVDAREAALNDVNRKYNQEFELMATDFEREKYGHREWFGAESVYDRAIYRQRWIFTMQDSEGRQFYTYLVRGSAFWIDGDFGGDYFSNCSGDTYGQVRIEEYLENEYGLSRYREDKSVGEPQKKADYVFVCSNGHADEIAEILTGIYFTETEFSKSGWVDCKVNNEDGDEMFFFRGKSVADDLKKENKEITETCVYEYILQKLEDALKLSGKGIQKS